MLQYENVIVIGTSSVIIECVISLKSMGFAPEVIEYQNNISSIIAEYCEKQQIKCTTMTKDELTNYLDMLTVPTLLISVYCTYIFRKEIVHNKHFTIINYHNSLLPKYAGRNVEAWSIFMQEKENGITWHYVTEDIGFSYMITPHTNIIDNNGQTIILSSDGITDLASEKTFKSYFKNDVSAKEMVDNAVYSPDEAPYKMEDNVSAIKIKLPNGNVKRRGI